MTEPESRDCERLRGEGAQQPRREAPVGHGARGRGGRVRRAWLRGRSGGRESKTTAHHGPETFASTRVVNHKPWIRCWRQPQHVTSSSSSPQGSIVLVALSMDAATSPSPRLCHATRAAISFAWTGAERTQVRSFIALRTKTNNAQRMTTRALKVDA